MYFKKAQEKLVRIQYGKKEIPTIHKPTCVIPKTEFMLLKVFSKWKMLEEYSKA